MRPTVVRTAIRAAERLSPSLAAGLALPLYRATGPRRRVLPGEAAVHDAAERSTIVVRGVRVAVYRWGRSARTALLVHGWQGRAAQFAPIIRELRGAGFAVVSFDAPAHGDSGGRHTDLPQQHEIVAHLAESSGAELLVAHSFGTLAALAVARDAVGVRRVAAIAPVADPEMTLQGFAAAVGLRAAGTEELRRRFIRAIGADDDVFARYSALRHPLPARIPLLLLHDPADRRVPVGQSLGLREAMPHADLRVLPGAGHSRILGVDETLDALLEFADATVPVA